ncbi:MAG: hypothetical protein Q9159_004097 [Coniocarpon cinnabarinum]
MFYRVAAGYDRELPVVIPPLEVSTLTREQYNDLEETQDILDFLSDTGYVSDHSHLNRTGEEAPQRTGTRPQADDYLDCLQDIVTDNFSKVIVVLDAFDEFQTNPQA